MQLRSFYFAHPEAFVIPAEELSPGGMSSAFAAAMLEEYSLCEDWVERFNTAFGLYFERAGALFERARATALPPRLQNVIVATTDDGVRPYVVPFAGSSWPVFASDFAVDPEFGAYMLVHLDRLGQTGDPGTSAVVNLAYWLLRTRDERQAFEAAAQMSTRPDAAAFVELGRTFAWIEQLAHVDVAPSTSMGSVALGKVGDTGLLAPKALYTAIDALAVSFRKAAAAAVRDFIKTQKHPPASKDTARGLADWVRERRPKVVITGPKDEVLWAWRQPTRMRKLRPALKRITERAARSVRADLEVISRRSEAFLDSVKDAGALPLPGADVEQEGGIYLHRAHKLVAYSLEQSALDTLREEAPPFHRMLVAARTAHEWGHLCEDAGLVGVADEARFADAKAVLARAYDRVVAATSDQARKALEGLPLRAGQQQAEGLVDFQLTRVGDWMANIVARKYLQLPELEAYIRVNVKSLAGKRIDPIRQIIRYAHEYQYLDLSAMADTFGYFMNSTWFRQSLVDRGSITESAFTEVLEATRALYACYTIDPAGFIDDVGDGHAPA